MRASISTIRRLERLELNLAVGRPIALWPPMMSFDEWEIMALPMQLELSVDTQDESVISRNTKPPKSAN